MSSTYPIKIIVPNDGTSVKVESRFYTYTHAASGGLVKYTDNANPTWLPYTGAHVYKFMGYWYEIYVVMPPDGREMRLMDVSESYKEQHRNRAVALQQKLLKQSKTPPRPLPLTSPSRIPPPRTPPHLHQLGQLPPPFIMNMSQFEILQQNPKATLTPPHAPVSYGRLTPGSGRHKKTFETSPTGRTEGVASPMSKLVDDHHHKSRDTSLPLAPLPSIPFLLPDQTDPDALGSPPSPPTPPAQPQNLGIWSDYWLLAHNTVPATDDPTPPLPFTAPLPIPPQAQAQEHTPPPPIPDYATNLPTYMSTLAMSPRGGPVASHHIAGSPNHPMHNTLSGGFGDRGSREPLVQRQSILEHEDESRRQWQRWATYAAEMERDRRVAVLREMEVEEERERAVRREWAIGAIEKERVERIGDAFLRSMTSSTWFADTISTFVSDYEVVCPYTHLGCSHTCSRDGLAAHIGACPHRNHDTPTSNSVFDGEGQELICPYSVLGCTHCCSREELEAHLKVCGFAGRGSRESEEKERARWGEVVIKEAEEERSRRGVEEEGVAKGVDKRKLLNELLQVQISVALTSLHTEIDSFGQKMRSASLTLLPARQAALKGICSVVDGLWGGSAQALLYGSCATGLDTTASDVDIVICFTKDGNVSELLSVGEVQKRVGVLALHLSTLPWLRIGAVVEHGRVPVIKALAYARKSGGIISACDANRFGDVVEIPLDISIDGPTHSGISSTSFVRVLTSRLPSLRPMILTLKRLLYVHQLNDPFTGGLSSYGLVLMVVFLMLKQRRLMFRSGSGERPDRDSATTPSHKNRAGSMGQGGDTKEGKRLLDPELQLSFGVSAAKTILSQAGFSAERHRSFLDIDDPQRGDEEDDWDDVDETLFGFTFFIQHQEYEESDSEEEEEEESGEEEDSTEEEEGEEDINLKKPPHENEKSESSDSSGEEGEEEEEGVRAPLTSKSSSSSPILWGQLLLDFFQFFGDDFDVRKEGFSVRGGGFSFPLHGVPPHPQANDPLVVEDPLNATNNVGRSNYRISQLQTVLTEALRETKSSIARHDRRRSAINVDGVLAAGGGRVGLLRGLLGLDANYDEVAGVVEAEGAVVEEEKRADGEEEEGLAEKNNRGMLSPPVVGLERRASSTSVKDDRAWIL